MCRRSPPTATTGFAPATSSTRTPTSHVESPTWARPDGDAALDALQAAAKAVRDRRRLLDRKRPGRGGFQGRRQSAQPPPHVPGRGPGRDRAAVSRIQTDRSAADDEDQAAGPPLPHRDQHPLHPLSPPFPHPILTPAPLSTPDPHP